MREHKSIADLPNADPETTEVIRAVFRELLRLHPLDPAPSLSVKAKEHISQYDPESETIYICLAPDADLPCEEELLEEIPRPRSWSGLLSEIVEEYIHAYQARIQGQEPSPQAVSFYQLYFKESWGKGHGPDFFEAAIRFARISGLDVNEVVGEISR
jgi:hypothetical protein